MKPSLVRFLTALAAVAVAACAAEPLPEIADGDDEIEQSSATDAGTLKPSDAGGGTRDSSRPMESSGRGQRDAGGADEAKPGDQGCATVRAEAKLEQKPVDIILTLDTSGSMAPHVCNVSKNLTSFAQAVSPESRVVTLYEMGILGILTQALCGSADPLAMTELARDTARYRRQAVMVDSFNSLTQIAGQYDAYEEFLRPNAALHIIVVSDDESDPLFGGLTAADFKMQMEQKLGRPFFFHSIVADGTATDCLYSRVGTQYLALSDQTGGQKLSICAQDWSVLFEKLEAAIVRTAEIPCDFEIPLPPRGETLDPEAVQVVFRPEGSAEEQFPRAQSREQCGDDRGWHYDDATAPKRIELCPSACEAVKRSGKVDIAFGCAPVFIQ